MSNYCKNCYELTEELENHKRWLNDYKQKLQDAEEFANAKITQCANLIKQLNETHDQLDQLKAENDELRQFLSKEPLAIQALQKSYESYQKSTKVFSDWVKDYKQLITEIKELCQKHIKAEKIVMANDILQKISECEGNNEYS